MDELRPKQSAATRLPYATFDVVLATVERSQDGKSKAMAGGLRDAVKRRIGELERVAR